MSRCFLRCSVSMIFRSDQRGVTLIELMAVLFILAIASSVVGLSIGRSLDKAAIREEAARLRSALRYARELSLVERIPVTFVVELDRGEYWIEKGEERYGRSIRISEKMEISGSERIVFFPKGQSTGGQMMIKDKKKRGYAVEVDKVTGEARLTRLQSS